MSARNVLRRLTAALIAGEGIDLASGDVLSVLPNADDQGAINIGDGTTDVDLKVFLGSTSEYVDFNVGDSDIEFAGVPQTFTGAGRTKKKVNALTSNTTLNSTHFGGIVTTRGASGAVVLTLPAASGNDGEWVEIYNVADQDLTVAGQDEELVVFNDLTADSIKYGTASEKIGGGFRCSCDGTSWIVVPLATETQTVTIASA